MAAHIPGYADVSNDADNRGETMGKSSRSLLSTVPLALIVSFGYCDASAEIIYSKQCGICHNAGGMGPSLKGEKNKKNQAAVVAWIKNLQPPMPKLYPSPLSEKEVIEIAAYAETL